MASTPRPPEDQVTPTDHDGPGLESVSPSDRADWDGQPRSPEPDASQDPGAQFGTLKQNRTVTWQVEDRANDQVVGTETPAEPVRAEVDPSTTPSEGVPAGADGLSDGEPAAGGDPSARPSWASKAV